MMIFPQITADTNEANTGLLLKRLLLPNPEFELHHTTSVNRPNVEGYIAEHFEHEYKAKIHSFLPMLMSMRCKESFSSAVGMRLASHAPLFLEQYLNTSIEKTIENSIHEPVKRSQIIEIGNLVATKRGASHLMFILIAAALIKTDIKWMVFTATGPVAKILRRLKFKTISICEADQTRLNQHDSQDEWGKYYSTQPQVLIGDMSQAFDLIHNNRLISYVAKHYDHVIRTLSGYLMRGNF